MTPEQQRTQTKMANLQRENLHRNCQVDIKKSGPHYGLYCINKKCRKTGSWLGWIKQEQVEFLLTTAK